MAYSYKSAISFGLVYVPITLHTTVKNKNIGFNMLYAKTGERIKYQKTCENCPPSILQSDIVKGYQYERGKYVTITDKEIESLKSEKDKSIEIIQFVSLDEIDPIYFEKSYYVNPTGAEKAFNLILQALANENKVGIAKTVLGQTEQLVALRAMNVSGSAPQMILYTMHFHDEVVKSPVKEIGEVVSKAELDLAKQVINNMTSSFDAKMYKDEYRERLQNAINAKISGKKIGTKNTADKAKKILDLMEALKASVAHSGSKASKTRKSGEERKKQASK